MATEASFVTASGQVVGQVVGQASNEASQALLNFWPRTNQEIKDLMPNDFKQQELPLARIKKIMKLDEDVKMISQEAPVVFARATEMFIQELTLRSWIHTEENKRRTLQRNDIAMAISKFDQFDFLIDIVPRDELKPPKRQSADTAAMMPDQVQYYFQLAQQHQAALNQGGTGQAGQALQLQVVSPDGQPTQVIQTAGVTTPQIIQIPAAAAQPAPAPGSQQVIHQIVTPTGEVQNVPIQLTPAQLQSLQVQVQGQRSGQAIVLQGGNNQTQTTTPQQTTVTQQTTDQTQQQGVTQPLFQIQQVPSFGNGQQQILFQVPSQGNEENQDAESSQ